MERCPKCSTFHYPEDPCPEPLDDQEWGGADIVQDDDDYDELDPDETDGEEFEDPFTYDE